MKSICFVITLLAISSCWADEKAAPDAPLLFAQNCAMCHGAGIAAPSIEQMGRLTVEEIEAALWFGTMQQHANGLSKAERLYIARWLASGSTGSKVRDPGVKMCDSRKKKHTKSRASWPGYSVDNKLTRHVADKKLTAKQASGIKLAWAHPFPNHSAFSGAGNSVAVKDGLVYTGNLNKWVYALDADRGCAVWTFRAEGRVRSNIALEGNILVFGDLLANVYGLDATNGRLLWRTRVDWSPGTRITGNVTFHDGVVYVPLSALDEVLAAKMDIPCCLSRGAIVALNAATGSIKWKSYTIEEYPEYLGHNDMGIARYGPSGANVWSGISIDEKRGLIYFGTGEQHTEPVVNESDAVIAMDIKTGSKRWVRSLAPKRRGGQDIYHMGCSSWFDPERKNCSPVNKGDGGDRDVSAPPALVTRTDGKDIIVAGTKDGMVYALDPDADGAVLWEIRAGKGGWLGGIQFGIAVNHQYAIAPIVGIAEDQKAHGKVTAIDLISGKVVWQVENIKAVCDGKPVPCSNGVLTPPTIVDEVVFVGLLDGTLRAYDINTGRAIWLFDTAREFDGVNGLTGRGGSLGNGGAVVVDDKLYITSGYDMLTVGIPGNVLLAFDIPR
jgi:polyvinyl alcohol dehydrogenase (cytochrome)